MLQQLLRERMKSLPQLPLYLQPIQFYLMQQPIQLLKTYGTIDNDSLIKDTYILFECLLI
jgi:hypothetical protein